MANEAYILKGTSKLVNGEAGADVAFSMEGVTTANGRVSAQIDWGAAPRPAIYEWSCEAKWQGTPSQGGVLELYVAGAPDADSTQIDGNVGSTDAALGDVDMRRNLRPIGVVVVEDATTAIRVASGTFEFTPRYMTIVGYNGGGTTLDATDSNFRFNIVPVYWQGQ